MAPLLPELWGIIISFLQADMAYAVKCDAITIQSYLRNLSLTSRQLNTITNPHLYEVPLTNHLILLVRTLVDNPALASLVKSLSYRLWNNWPSAPSRLADLGPKFARLVREYDARLVQHRRSVGRRYDLLGVWFYENDNPYPRDDDGEIPWNPELFKAVIIGLLPNLIDIRFTTHHDRTPILPGMLFDSLPHLVSVRIKFDSPIDPISGRGPRPLKRLALIAPNIVSLALVDTDFSGRRILIDEFRDRRMDNQVVAPNSLSPAPVPMFHHVTQLCLKGLTLVSWQLPAMLYAFPALESLHIDIEPRTEDHLHTQVLEARLLEYAPVLRRLLVKTMDFCADIPKYYHEARTWSPRLAGAEKLQILETTLKLIRRDIDPALPPFSPLSTDWLVRIMPPSLEVLAVRVCDDDCARHIETLVPALRGLAEAIELGAFPVFKTLVFPGGIVSEGELLASFEALEKQGVEVVTEARFESCLAPGKILGCVRSYDRFLQA